MTVQSDFSHSDDVRKYVPQLQKENMEANQPILDLLDHYAKSKNATKAQISLSWMLHKYPNVVPIPGSKNQERILENLGNVGNQRKKRNHFSSRSCIYRNLRNACFDRSKEGCSVFN